MKTKLTILIPTYNRSQYIIECLNSLLNQTFQDFVIHIYDDGSTDDTIDKINSVKDKRIKIIGRGKINNGCGYARNRLLESVKTKLIGWQDSDDLSNIHRLEEQVQHVINNPKAIVFSRYLNFSGNEHPDLKNDKFTGRYINHIALPLALHTNQDLISFEEDLRSCCEDVVWMRRIFLKKQILVLNKIMYYRRIHIGNTYAEGMKVNKDNIKSAKLAYKKLKELEGIFPLTITQVLPEINIKDDLNYLKNRYKL